MNGRVPANLIDANGRRLINLFPLPNADPAFTDGYNYVQNIPLNQNMHQWLTRFDVNVSTNTRLFAATTCRRRSRTSGAAVGRRHPNRGAGYRPPPLTITASQTIVQRSI